MIKIIFDHIIETIGSDLGVRISYEDVKEKFNLNVEQFQTMAKEYSNSFGLKSKNTKDDISFIKIIK